MEWKEDGDGAWGWGECGLIPVNVPIAALRCNACGFSRRGFLYFPSNRSSNSLDRGSSMKQALGILGILTAAGIVLSLILQHTMQRGVTMLFVNGTVYTVNDRQPRAEAVAIDGDRIVGVGTNEEILRRFTADRVIDLRGRAMYPGFIDSHAHLEGLGASIKEVDLTGAESPEEAASLVAAAVRSTVPGGWIRGRGWDQTRWHGKNLPTHGVLDRASPDAPVFLLRVDGHAVWVNRKAMTLAGITRTTPDTPGGRIVRDTRGEATGVFVDNAILPLEAVLPSPTTEERMDALKKAADVCLANGLTEVHDMGVDSAGIDMTRQLITAGRIQLRMVIAVDGMSASTWEMYRKSGPVINDCGGRLTIRGVKFYADGALGSRGAALLEPYDDDPGNRGLTLVSQADLLKAAREALSSGFQMCTHAIGDRANAIVLDVYAEALKSDPAGHGDRRWRIEHAQVLSATDIPRFAQLGILPMMQPTHATSDMRWAEARLGPKRILGAYAWRSLLDHGSIIPGGSDFPVESPNPLLGFYAAITRQDRNGKPAGGWFPEQCMTRSEALKSFTLWGAYAGFQEKDKGSIEPGKWADMVVLSKDIMTVEPREILDTSVEMTMIGGSIVYTPAVQNVAVK